MTNVDTPRGRPERTRVFGLRPDSFRPLGPQCQRATIGRELGPAELERVAALLRERPDVMLHIHDRKERTLEILRHFPRLRRLSVSIWELDDISGLSHLEGDLEQLHFDKTRKRFSLRFLEAMPNLQSLSLVGHSKDIAVVGSLSRLTSVALRSITLPELSVISALSQLRSFSLMLGGTRSVSRLAELPNLETLSLFRIAKLSDLSVLAELESLRTLELDSMPNVTVLPSLANLMRLEEVTLETMKGLADLASVAAAPALRRLTVAGMPQLEAEAFRCLVGHPHLTALRLWSSLGGVSLRKPALQAVRRMLPGIADPPGRTLVIPRGEEPRWIEPK